ncbi:MAG: aminotransferase class III-fold pyridoxal phosphate-dependent enzyme [Gammaproteobacteria bacterium]|nr:aminotransferase class III-fold pyridoxal phosphate-dependent enzyme [Gammaproteobacteria bacterium]
MPFNILGLNEGAEGRNYELHEAHVSPGFAKTLRTTSFDRCYTRAEGAYQRDNNGRHYIDMLSGYGIFNMGRNHPALRAGACDRRQPICPVSDLG